ncbi:mitochondrial aldehyde dehydrogenase [Dichotomocladium elegans]|nr:mitochondrial aldehyde dehydrogenase [Dichotomocladium elegans]
MAQQFLKGLGPFIHNRWVTAGAAKRQLINPRTRQPLELIHETTEAHVQQAVAGARSSLWGQTCGSDRRDALLGIANALEKHKAVLQDLEMLQTGKPREDAVYEIADTIECFRFFAGHADKQFGQTLTEKGLYSTTMREPYGVVGLVTSFNYPLLLAGWKVAPALAAGNSVVLKPAPQTPLTALALAQLAEPYLPPGTLAVLPGGADAGQWLLGHVDKLSFTGSTRAGQSIMRALAENLTPATLECGGKNPVLVLDDADVDVAAAHVAHGAFSNAGQNCCAVSRVLVHRAVHDRFVEALVERYAGTVRHGPLIDETQYTRVRQAIAQAGTRPIWVGKDEPNEGYYVPPTIFAGLPDDAPLATEEIFGPVLTVLEPFDDISSALARANRSPYGLAGGVFSRDFAKAHKVASGLRVGYVWINTYNYMPPYTPFGGRKLSGIGKDLGQAALDDFSFTKSVVIGL